jgi:hypothetical protein
MSTAIQRRRGTGAQHSSFTGLLGEFTFDTTDNRIVAHDGVTPGGHPVAKESEVTGFATIASPTFTGTPAAPTAAAATNTTQIATTAFVRTEIANLADSAPAALDTLNELAAALGDDPNFATTMTNALAAKAPLASPAFTGNPTVPTQSTSDDSTKAASTAFVHDVVDAISGGGSVKRNRIVNPAMQISSVNGNTSGTTDAYVPADSWQVDRVTSAGTITVQRVQSRTPNGSLDRLRVTITAADASLAAGEYLKAKQSIIGREVADLQYGLAGAVDTVLRFGFKGPQGTYAVALHNSALNRSYVALFTISAPQANTDTEQELAIPGDTSGTWLTDTGIGITVDIVLACGSTFQGATGWQAGNILGTSGVSNGMGTISSVFEVFDVGLYADPDSTGTAPEWELPSYRTESGLGPHVLLEDQKAQNTGGGTFTSGADQTRVLNTKVYDPNGYCTLSSNQFTLIAGTWHISWAAPAYAVNKHQSWLYNVSDAATVQRGSSCFSSATGEADPGPSFGDAVVTISGSKAFEIRHRCETTYSVGFGGPANFGTEVYTRVQITKVG